MTYSEPSHPVTQRPLTDLDRTMLRLRFVALEAQYCHRAIARPVENECAGSLRLSGDMEFVIANHALLIVSKFLEVWRTIGKAGSNAAMQQVRRAVAPLVDRIGIWPALAEHRGSTLAHAYLTGDRKFIHPAHHLGSSGAPSRTAEVVVLLQCVLLSIAATLARFQREYDALKPLMRVGPEPAVTRGISTGRQIRAELKPLAEIVNKNLSAIGLTLREQAFAEFRNAITPGAA